MRPEPQDKPAGIDPLRDYENFRQSLRNFQGWLDGIVSGASDVDLLIERRGHFFVAELKPWNNGVTLAYGQFLALKSLAGLPQFDVWLVGEDSGTPATTPDSVAVTEVHLHRLTPASDPVMHKGQGRLAAWYEPRLFRQAPIAEFQSLVRDWWDLHSD